MKAFMKTIKKAACMMTAAALAAALLAGCVAQTGEDGKTDPTGIAAGTDAPADATDVPQATEEGKDVSGFPLYIDPEQAAYAFPAVGRSAKTWDDPAVYTPYWLGNVIYNETVMCIDDGKNISGKLQYAPVKILSVRNYALDAEFKEGTDYTVEGNVISLTRGTTTAPYLTEENTRGVNIPAPYRKVAQIANIETDYSMWGSNQFLTEGSLIYGHQLCVSYVYDVKDVDRSQFPGFGSAAPKFLAKLKAGENVVIGLAGDSVGEGCSASSKFNHAPYMPQFPNLFSYALKAAYDGKVTIKNYCVGGTTSNDGVSKNVAASLVKAKSDIVLFHFGINDSGILSASKFKSNIKQIVDDTLAGNPECEFLYMKCFTPSPALYNDNTFKEYWKAIDELAAEYDCFYSVDLYTPSRTMLETKKYLDVTHNYVNHPNDFVIRLYAMELANLFVDYAGAAANAEK